MADDDDFDAAEWFEEAGFSATPPRYKFDPALDVESLRAHLKELAHLQHAGAGMASDGFTADLAQPFSEQRDLLRAYVGDGPCETLVITFGGLTQGFPGQPTPGEAQFEFVGALRRIGITHSLFVRDPLQSWYMRSWSSWSSTPREESDPFEALISLLRHELAVLKHKPSRLVTIGASMGGYAAVRAALELGAELAIGFGPQIFLHPEERRHLRLPWAVMDSPLEALHRNAAAVGICDLENHSLAALVRAAALEPCEAARAASHEPMPRADTMEALTDATSATRPARTPERSVTAIVLHVGGKSDLLEARLLHEAACDAQGRSTKSRYDCTVTVHMHRRYGHNLAFQMRANGFLEPLLRAHLEPLHAAPNSAVIASVASIVASDNAGEQPCVVAGSRPVESREERLNKVRLANAGESLWLARELRVGQPTHIGMEEAS